MAYLCAQNVKAFLKNACMNFRHSLGVCLQNAYLCKDKNNEPCPRTKPYSSRVLPAWLATPLERVLNALDNAKDDAELSEIRTELAESGFIRRQVQKKGQQKPKKSNPLRYISSDGYEILVGKSNLQNDELTLRVADPTDLWMHTKDIPGSHVIIRTNGQSEVPVPTMEEAANLNVKLEVELTMGKTWYDNK